MITFKRIKFKNFRSVGNKPVEIKFNKDGLCLVTGGNGLGKTSFFSAITFALFGKNVDMKGESKSSIPVKELVNDQNKKELEVELEFESGHIIRRGVAPDYLEIIDFDGKNLADKSSKTIDQKFIEDNLLGGISFDMFNKINYISAKSISTPFLYQTPSQRKEFIENILDIRIIFYINEVIKKKVSSLKLDIKNTNYKLSILNNNIIQAEESIKRQEQQRQEQQKKLDEIKNNKQSMINEATSRLDEYKKQYVENNQQHMYHKADIERINEDIDEIKKDITLDILTSSKQQLEIDIENIKNNMIKKKNERDVYHNNLKGFELCGDCPTVEKIVGVFDEDNYKSFINISTIQIKDKMKEIDSINQSIDYQNELVKQIQIKEAMINESIHEDEKLTYEDKGLKDNIIKEQNLINSLQGDIDGIEPIVVDTKPLVLLEEEKLVVAKLYDDLVMKLNQYDRIKKRVGDKTLKQELLGYYLPIFENKLNELLANFMEDDEFTFSIKLDDDFNINGFKNGKKTNIFKLSEGQKSSIVFAFLFSFQYILNLKNSYSLNILLVDEVMDIAIDANRIYKIVEHMKELATDKPIYLISHNSILKQSELFDSNISVSKEYGFTKYTEE